MPTDLNYYLIDEEYYETKYFKHWVFYYDHGVTETLTIEKKLK